jgi:phospholipase C
MKTIGLGGIVLALSALQLPAANGTINDVQHVVIFVQENRSFDHYFGSLKGVRGFSDPNILIFQDGTTDLHQPQNGGGYVLPFHLTNHCVVDLDHSWGGTHYAWNAGKWDQWVPNKGTTTMAYHTRADLAYYYALADAYTICDANHCSVMGPTNPNRLYLWTGMVDPNGTGGGPVTDNSEPGFSWTTYPERLQNAGVSWKIYQQSDNFDDNALAWFVQYRNASPGNPLYGRGIVTVSDIVAAFQSDVTNSTLPRVSWIIAPTDLSEHPSASPDSGAVLTKRLLDALASNPTIYNSTVFILAYDENDGFFDHVPAPVPPPGTPDEFVNGLPIGLGVRVPMILVSPWSRGGFVCSQVFDHSSIIRFLETWTGVPEPNISAWRRALCGDLTSAFNFANLNTDYPSLPAPTAVNCSSGVTPPVPLTQSIPVQEPGTNSARPLPYQLNISSYTDCVAGRFYLIMTNSGRASAHLAIYPNAFRTDGPWQYDVPPVCSVVDSFDATTARRYDLTAYGPNGFQRRFSGNTTNRCNQIEVTSSLDPIAGSITLAFQNTSASTVTFSVGTRNFIVSPEATNTSTFSVGTNYGWYDYTATASGDATFLRRFVGHIETGTPVGTGPPFITTQPASQSVTVNTNVSFSVAALNGPLTYQWKLNGVNIPNATNSTYVLTNVTPANSGVYGVLVGNAAGATLSNPAQLAVINATPQIFSQPIAEVADVGSSFTFSFQTSGGQPLTHLWYRRGVLVATSLTNSLTLTNLQLSDAGGYQLVVSNSFGTATSSLTVLRVYGGPITSNLVVHLALDNNFNDTSGRGNHAAYATNGVNANLNPTFVPGKIGQAFQYTTQNDGTKFTYATLGYPNDLQFGVTNDWSVAMWVNYTNQSDDLPFISNKDWDASANQGWGIFTQSSGNFRINVTGPNSNADKFDRTQTPVIRDGTWHHIVVSFLRAPASQSAYVYAYVDGVLTNKSVMNLTGDIDTFALPFANHQGLTTHQSTWAVNIGQDGTGVYDDKGNAYDIAAKIDDVGIWRRALTANEAMAIYNAGQAGRDLSQAALKVKLLCNLSGGTIHINWIGSPTIKLQKTVSLSPAVWNDVPGTLGASSASLSTAGNAAYFRLSQ